MRMRGSCCSLSLYRFISSFFSSSFRTSCLGTSYRRRWREAGTTIADHGTVSKEYGGRQAQRSQTIPYQTMAQLAKRTLHLKSHIARERQSTTQTRATRMAGKCGSKYGSKYLVLCDVHHKLCLFKRLDLHTVCRHLVQELTHAEGHVAQHARTPTHDHVDPHQRCLQSEK